MTYYLERGDGTWTAFVIRLMRQTDEGAWILHTDFKTSRGESSMWFRSDPDAASHDLDPVPIRTELIRGSDANTHAEVRDDPRNQSPLAMNLLWVRRFPNAIGALREAPRHVQYPCGITRVHCLITPGAGYDKHHDLNPHVLVTGVACLSINDGQNPMIATSFGLSDPTVPAPSSYDDFVDFSHHKLVSHEGFSLSYPATWFLRPQGTRQDRETTVEDYFAQVGGVSCACSLSVSLRRGSHDRLTAIRSEMISYLSATIEGPMGRLHPRRRREGRPTSGDVFSFQLDNPGIDGVAFTAVAMDPSGLILAQVDAFGCVAKGNPLRESTVRQMSDVLPHIVSSVRFVP